MITEILKILPDRKPDLLVSDLCPFYSLKNYEITADFMSIAFIDPVMVRGILFGPGGEVYGLFLRRREQDLKIEFDERERLGAYIGKQLGLPSPVSVKKLKFIGYKNEKSS